MLLLGDAGHATTPNMAQGASMAVEDAAELARCLRDTPDVAAAFRRFEQCRLPRTRRIIRTSRQLGWLGQLESPWLARLRNAAMRRLPGFVSQRQLAWQMSFELPRRTFLHTWGK